MRFLRGGATLVAAAALAGVALIGCADDSGDAATPGVSSSASPAAVPGFGQVAVEVVDGDGGERELCALLADDDESRRQGLMGRDDLSGHDAMVFAFDEPTTGTFWMKDTTLALSIAFYDVEGRFVSSTDMEPCPEGDDCPTYGADGAYVQALEVPQGELAGLGLGPGSAITVGGSCSG